MVAKNPSFTLLLSDSNLTNKVFPILGISKLPKLPLNFSIWFDWSFVPSYIVKWSQHDSVYDIEKSEFIILVIFEDYQISLTSKEWNCKDMIDPEVTVSSHVSTTLYGYEFG